MDPATCVSESPLLPDLNNDVESNNLVSDGRFSFVDFLPDCKKPSGILSKPEFENFGTLIDSANDWLRENPRWKVITCESVEFKAKDDNIDYDKMVYREYRRRETTFTRGLRLWIGEKESDFNKPQQIGYLNLVPSIVGGGGGILFTPEYETLDEVVAKFNRKIQERPLPGHIITIETQQILLAHQLKADPDRSYWTSCGPKRFLFILRIFYEISDKVSEKIGIMDFEPNPISGEGYDSFPKYEPFPNLVDQASNWSAKQQGIRICNIQSIEMKIKKGKEAVDLQKMNYFEHGNQGYTYYLKILRLAYTKIRDSLNKSLYPAMNLSKITCRTFIPLQLTNDTIDPKHESLRATKDRVTAWVRATGAEVISVQTAAMRLYTGGEKRYGPGTTFTYNTINEEHWIFAIRVYMNGDPPEPPKEMLPPVPEIEDTDCCTVS